MIAPESRAIRKLCHGTNFQRRWPEVGIEDITVDLLQARFWVASGLPANRELTGW